MSSIDSNISKSLIGLVLMSSLTGVCYANDVNQGIKVQASFKRSSNVAANMPALTSRPVLQVKQFRAVDERVDPRSNNASRRFMSAGRYPAVAAVKKTLARPMNGTPRQGVDPAERVIQVASRNIGVKYTYGGNSPETGFDCSGLTRDAMIKGAGVVLPRTAAAQYAVSTKVPINQAMRGDLVFFNTTRQRRVSHVGLYLGNSTFLHAPRTGKRIQRSALQGYWQHKLIGFGRIPGACKIPAFYG